jgi:hypothetical protein
MDSSSFCGTACINEGSNNYYKMIFYIFLSNYLVELCFLQIIFYFNNLRIKKFVSKNSFGKIKNVVETDFLANF